ncbi:peroxin 20 [Aspergillus sclerotialis]|uniref:Peroxin 20 n=1 Tax=Aspergillus sclerotialis TaxID=2070753 RepID=A0A3A2ZR82_9EURO|nr:peroxin 20 [Aspergillus sclerotialis]
MGDALCGPSNALQNFQKHTAVDRTLQQDRLISRQSPSQGFRSQNLQDGALDSEFATFEAGLPETSLPETQLPGPSFAPTRQLPIPHHTGSSNWAADFQRLQISGPSTSIPQHRSPSAFNAPAISQHGWQNEFLNQHQKAPVQNAQHYNHNFQPSFTPMYPMHSTTMNTFQTPQDVTTNHAPTETFDESAFEEAFEQASADMLSQADGLTQQDKENLEETVQPSAIETDRREDIKIGSDNIPNMNHEDAKTQVNDADELARTAGQLLDSVRHDQSQKFKESNFLALMRRIRDREIQVEGDEFREVSTSP